MSSGITEGKIIGPYKIIRSIGKGGMGEVYLASEERLRRNVALKVISPAVSQDESALRRFQSEGQTLALISHKNVVSVYSIDHIDGYHFIAMEYIEGKPLSALTKNFVLPAAEAAALFQQMVEGLGALHAKNVVHRDIKPHNIIFQKDSVIKIIDLGIAKSFNDNNIHATTAGIVLGTVQYLAPEITLGRPATVLSDIWAMGAIFFEILTGAPLIKANNFAQAMRIVSNLKFEFPPEAGEAIPPEMQAIIRRMCATDPADRYHSCGEIAQDLRSFSARHPSEGKWFYRYCGRDIKNVAEVKQRLIQRGRTEYQAKQIVFMALQEADIKKEEAIDPEKTLAIQTTTSEEVLSDENLSTAMESLTRISRVYTRRIQRRKNFKFFGTGAAAIALAFAGYQIFSQLKNVPVPAKPAPMAATPAVSPTPPPAAPAPEVVEKEIVPPPEFQVEPPKPAPAPVPEAKPAPVAAEPVVEKKIKHKTEPSLSSLTPQIKNADIELNLKGSQPELSWEKMPNAARYEVQISKDRGFGKIDLTQNTEETTFKWRDAWPGKFFWRVRAHNSRGQSSNYSNAGRLKLTIPAVALPPEIRRTASNDSFQINWKAQPFESQFRVLISRDPTFASTEKTMIVRKPAADIVLNEAGTFYTKVAAIDSTENEVSEYSNITKISLQELVKLNAPNLMSPPKDAKIPSGGGMATLLMLWSKVEKADSYEMEIATDENFKNVLIKKDLPTNRLTLKQKLEKGTVYWRTRAKGGSAMSAWSTGRFELQ